MQIAPADALLRLAFTPPVSYLLRNSRAQAFSSGGSQKYILQAILQGLGVTLPPQPSAPLALGDTPMSR